MTRLGDPRATISYAITIAKGEPSNAARCTSAYVLYYTSRAVKQENTPRVPETQSGFRADNELRNSEAEMLKIIHALE